ncbi:hypothetical protein HaLaN_29025 [Haematococcus lacustris]|uniref:Uncharacterized protein n=1 Tax=Haematococcus lacustris TaxID=44745 RepID=A0A6A0ABI2_HAELA|nr:hypothetical protein HaLaN_29025 [Haematococcus lacustris]
MFAEGADILYTARGCMAQLPADCQPATSPYFLTLKVKNMGRLAKAVNNTGAPVDADRPGRAWQLEL